MYLWHFCQPVQRGQALCTDRASSIHVPVAFLPASTERSFWTQFLRDIRIITPACPRFERDIAVFPAATVQSPRSCLTLSQHLALGLSFPILKVKRIDLVTQQALHPWNTVYFSPFLLPTHWHVCSSCREQSHRVWMEPGPWLVSVPGAKRPRWISLKGNQNPVRPAMPMPSGKCLQSLNSQPTHWSKPSSL